MIFLAARFAIGRLLPLLSLATRAVAGLRWEEKIDDLLAPANLVSRKR